MEKLLIEKNAIKIVICIFHSLEDNVLRMDSSVKLNKLITDRSKDASLIIVNLPGPPPPSKQHEGLNCILMH